MRSSPSPSFSDLPFLIAGLSLGFQSLIKRLRQPVGLRENVAIGMGSIFFALSENDDGIMKDLTERLHMPKGTLSGLVARMEAMGLIERTTCLDDGRAVCLRLTRRARAMEDSLRARHQQAIAILQRGLSAKDVAELQRLLGRVLENLRPEQTRRPRATRRRAQRTSTTST